MQVFGNDVPPLLAVTVNYRALGKVMKSGGYWPADTCTVRGVRMNLQPTNYRDVQLDEHAWNERKQRDRITTFFYDARRLGEPESGETFASNFIDENSCVLYYHTPSLRRAGMCFFKPLLPQRGIQTYVVVRNPDGDQQSDAQGRPVITCLENDCLFAVYDCRKKDFRECGISDGKGDAFHAMPDEDELKQMFYEVDGNYQLRRSMQPHGTTSGTTSGTLPSHSPMCVCKFKCT